jgi:murein endopeptidase
MTDEDDDLPPEDGDDGDLEPLAEEDSDSGSHPRLPGAWDSEDEDEDEPVEATAQAKPRRRGLGPVLLGVGGGIWALVAVMRCGEPKTEVPSLAVDNSEEPAPAEPSPKEAKTETPAESAEPPTPPGEESPEIDRDPAPADPGSIPSPRPAPAAWVASLSPPDVVHYTIRRGGSAENVANLFKIFHHEILELNPGISLEQELPPNTKLVVYRRDEDAKSESVGLPSNGSLEGGVPMVEGPGRELKAIPWKSWGSQTTVAILDHLLRDWADRGHTQPILVGNMASRSGGRLPPHSTHQSGRDVDLGYPQKLAAGAELNWVNATDKTLDAAATWDLLLSLARSGTVEVIYMDRGIQKLLYEHAVNTKLMPKAKLAGWMEYPKPTGSGNPLMQHVKGHIDHLHVRFRCQPHETRCKSRKR